MNSHNQNSSEMNLPNSGRVGLPLPNSTVKMLRETLKESFGKFIFRRVHRVLPIAPGDMLSVEKYYIDKEGDNLLVAYDHYSPEDYDCSSFNSTEKRQNLEFKYRKFAFFTSTNKLRDNDVWHGKAVYCASSKYRQIDVLSKECTFAPISYDQQRPKMNSIAPREEDLICMEVEIGPKGTPQAKWWFTCSEQFMHAWTVIMYDTHESFGGNGNEHLRKWCFTGNRIQTNTFLKWSLAHEDNGISPDLKEARERYFRLRTESVSKKWVHTYCAMVMMARFGELPCVENIPNNMEELKMTKWDLPRNFVQNLLMKTDFFQKVKTFIEGFPISIQNRYYDLEGTIFERKSLKTDEYLDRPSIEGETEIKPVPEKIDVENLQEFPTLFDSIRDMCSKKERCENLPPMPKKTIIPEPKVLAKENTISFWWAEEKIESWADACCPVPEDSNQEEKPKEWSSRFEKISIVMKEENELKFEKIKLEKETALEKMKIALEQEMRNALEKIKKEMDQEMELTLNKIKLAFE